MVLLVKLSIVYALFGWVAADYTILYVLGIVYPDIHVCVGINVFSIWTAHLKLKSTVLNTL